MTYQTLLDDLDQEVDSSIVKFSSQKLCDSNAVIDIFLDIKSKLRHLKMFAAEPIDLEV